MSVKEAGKEIAKLGLLALLLNPLMLLILLIVGIIVLVVSIGLIIYYGLVTAITLFVLSGAGILILHYLKAIDLTKQPFLATLPFIMLAVGYLGEKVRLFTIQPLWTTEQPTAIMQPQILLIIILLLIFGIILAGRRKA